MRAFFIGVLFFFAMSGVAQETHISDVMGILVGGDRTYCKGDLVTLELKFSCVCGAPSQLFSTLNKNVGNCIWACEITEVFDPKIQGPGIIWHSSPESVDECDSPGSSISCQIIASETAEYTIQWSKKDEYEALPAQCNFEGRTYIYNYSASTTITVIDPNPTLSADKTTVTAGETINLRVNNCIGEDRGVFEIEEKCGLYKKSGLCSDPVAELKTPDYTTTLRLRVRERVIGFCQSEWSDYITIEVVEEPSPDACSNSTINEIEDILKNWDKNRSDYHIYNPHEQGDDNIVCNMGTDGCTLGNVWSFLKSNVYYQAPNEDDFFENPQFTISKSNPVLYGLQSDNEKIPITNCMEIQLAAVDMRVAASLLDLIPSVEVHLLDPVKIVIDEASKCITNYTLEGHILFPGKIRRCLTVDNCSNIKIETIGTGFHFLGDTRAGAYFANKNKDLGKHIFRQVDKRFIQEFKNH